MNENVPGYDFQTLLKIAICIDITRLGLVLSSLNAQDLSEVKAHMRIAHILLGCTVAVLTCVTVVQYVLEKIGDYEKASGLMLFVPELTFDGAILTAYVVIYVKLNRQYFSVHGKMTEATHKQALTVKAVRATQRSIQLLFVSIAQVNFVKIGVSILRWFQVHRDFVLSFTL